MNNYLFFVNYDPIIITIKIKVAYLNHCFGFVFTIFKFAINIIIIVRNFDLANFIFKNYFTIFIF